ncbi:discoidin domain-containing protein [Ornithobacterium rhinotracheale]|uniref:discoidin domain-containing protein n=1 Tax=Ornithobacterium rhinotracheale TaxID=28251 RepID=UPI003FA4C65A
MKKLTYILSSLVLLTAFTSCSNDDEPSVKPSDIKDIKSFEKPGAIGITWKYDEPVNIEYIKFSYLDKRTGKEAVRLASKYSDTIIIPGTLKRLGDYEFKIQPFSYTQTGGNIHDLIAQSGRALIDTISTTDTAITLTEANLTSNETQPGRETKWLFDGNTSTFFHSKWSNPQEPVHWLELDVDEAFGGGIKFYYSGRDNGNNYPTEIIVKGSNDGNEWDTLKTISSGLPNPSGQIANYTSDVIWFKPEKTYKKFRFVVAKTEDGQRWFVMSEFKAWKVTAVTEDPEKE